MDRFNSVYVIPKVSAELDISGMWLGGVSLLGYARCVIMCYDNSILRYLLIAVIGMSKEIVPSLRGMMGEHVIT